MTDPQAGPASSSSRAWLLGLLVAALAGGAWWLASRPGEPTETPSPSPSGPTFLNATPEVAYVGSEACVACHEDEAERHASHPHASSFGAVEATGELGGELVHAPSAMTYRVTEEAGTVRVRGSLSMGDGSEELLSEQALSHWIGSGTHLRQYAAEPDGFMMLAPLVRRPEAAGWQIDAQCDGTLQPDFARPVDPACIRCHAGRAEQVDRAVHRYRVLEASIGCERCHGPGALHVEHQRALAASKGTADPAPAPDLTIANPARMPRRQALAICAQCHMSPALTVPRSGTLPGAWQAAQPWESAQVTFRPAGHPDAVPHAGHVDLLAASPCFQASESLTCLTCHDAHGREEAAATRARTQAACVQCHGDCGRPEPAAKPSGEECAACHMPAAAARSPHVVFHDHRLGRPGGAPEEPTHADLEAFLGDPRRLDPAARRAAEGLAAAFQAPWFQNPVLRTEAQQRARRLLDEVHDSGRADARTTARRALQRFLEAGKAAGAPALVDTLKPLLQDETRLATLAPEEVVELRTLLLDLLGSDRGPSDDEFALLGHLTRERRTVSDWARLGLQRTLRGDAEGGRAALLQARRIWPTNPGMQGEAAQMFHAQGDAEAAARADRIYQRLLRQQSYVAPR